MRANKEHIRILLLIAVLLLLLGLYHDKRTCWGSNDFDTFYFAGKLAVSGENLYTHEAFKTGLSPFLYLPFFAALISPLACLHIRIAGTIWYVLGVLSMAGSAYLSLRLMADKEHIRGLFRGGPYFVKIAALAAILAIWLDNISLAQVDVMIFFLMVLSLFAHDKGRRFLSGVVLAAAAVIKIYPAYFLLYFLAKRRFKAAAGFFAGLLLFLLIIPWTALGTDPFLDSMQSWKEIRVAPYLETGGENVRENYARFEAQLKPKNQALSGIITRYFIKDDPDILFWKEEDYEYKIYWPHPLTPRQTDILVRTLLLLVLAGSFASLDYRKGRQSRLSLNLEYSVMFLSMLLLFPMVKSHTFAPAIFPILVYSCMRTGMTGETPHADRGMDAAFLAALALYALQGVEYMQVLGAGCFSVVVLWGVCLVLLRRA